MLVVSHDRYFLDRICDQVVAFEEGGLFVQLGNYSYYLEKKKERDALGNEAAWASVSKAAARKPGAVSEPIRRLKDALAGQAPPAPAS